MNYTDKYAIPYLEKGNKLNMLEYSTRLASTLENQLNKIQTPLIYKGQVDTFEKLPTNAKNGEVYSVVDENKNYVFNGTEWIEYATTIDFSQLEQKTIKILQEVETPQPVKGESIDLTDSAEYRIQELNFSGNSKQETRSGKNKLYIPNQTKTISGITFTVENGVINYNGTWSTGGNYIILDCDMTLPAGKYIRSMKDSLSKVLSWQFYNDSTATYDNFASALTITETIHYSKMRFWIDSLGTVTNGKNYVQIEEGSVASEWEQYGVMPSPEYPSENKSCGDNVNEFDGVIQNAYVHQDGLLVDDTNWISSTNFLLVKPNTNYVISANSTATRILYAEYSSNASASFISPRNETTLNTAFKTGSNTKYIRFSLNDINATEIKLEKGTKPSRYSKYGQGCINEIIHNKNLFNKDTVTKGYYIYNNQKGASDIYCYSDYIPVKENEEYIWNTSTSTAGTFISYYDKDKQFLSHWSSTGNIAHSIPSNCKYVIISIPIDTLDTAMFVKGDSIPSDYVTHQLQNYTIPTQQPMRAIGDVRDTFIKKNGKRYEKHYIGRLVLTGDENFATSGAGVDNGVKAYRTNFTITGIQNINSFQLICSHIRPATDWFNNTTSNQIYQSSGNFYFRIDESVAPDISSLQAWIAEQKNAGTPVYIDYILENPVDIECTEEQNAILDEIEDNAKTYQGVTHIYSTDEISPNISVTYKKDIAKLFANTLVESGG